MKRLAAHFVFFPPDQVLRQQVVELEDDNRFIRTFPLEKEIEQTVFYSGTLVFSKETGDAKSEIQAGDTVCWYVSSSSTNLLTMA